LHEIFSCLPMIALYFDNILAYKNTIFNPNV